LSGRKANPSILVTRGRFGQSLLEPKDLQSFAFYRIDGVLIGTCNFEALNTVKGRLCFEFLPGSDGGILLNRAGICRRGSIDLQEAFIVLERKGKEIVLSTEARKLLSD